MTATKQTAPTDTGRQRLVTPGRVVALVGLVVLVAAILSVKVVSIEEATAGDPAAFDPAVLAEELFESEIVPYIEENATDLATVLAALADGADPASYGNSSGAGNAYAFPVTFVAVAGEATPPVLPVTVEGIPAGVTVVVQIGPSVSGTAIRDVSGLIAFDQFTNQLEFQNVGTELNNLVKADVLAGIDTSSLAGKTIRVTGAFLAGNPSFVSVVPTSIEVIE